MRTLFSTSEIEARLRFKLWRELIHDRMGPIKQSRISDDPFEGLIESTDLGGLRITRVRENNVRSEITPQALRQRERTGSAFALIQLAGCSVNVQDDREAIQRCGEIVLLADRPNVHLSGAGNQSLVVELPVEPLERMLGSIRNFTALTFGGEDGTGSLVKTYFNDLVRVHGDLTAQTIERLAGVGTDLIIASLADRLSKDVPRSLSSNVLVQRTKAYVETHFGNPALDPCLLAEAIGVSLRRLQELFHERGQHISDWIWQRRLEAAATQLANPGLSYLSIGVLSYGCGFRSQSHFSRRFRERYGMTPREHRYASLMTNPKGP